MLARERATRVRSTVDRRQVAGHVNIELNTVAQADAVRVDRFVQELGDVDRRRPDRGRRGKARELGRDLSQKLYLRENGGDAFLEYRAERLAAIDVHTPQMLGVELNGRQRVLDFVRDLAGHLRPRLEPVCPFQLLLLALQLAGHAIEVPYETLQLVG